MEAPFHIDVPIRSLWGNVEIVRSSVEGWMRGMLGEDASAGTTVAMVAAELAENAVKYGHYPGGEGLLRVRVWGDRAVAHVEVESPLARAGEVPGALAEVLAALGSFASPKDAFEAKLREGTRDGVSGLGLARVGYEAGAPVRVEARGEQLVVCADVALKGAP